MKVHVACFSRLLLTEQEMITFVSQLKLACIQKSMAFFTVIIMYCTESRVVIT